MHRYISNIKKVQYKNRVDSGRYYGKLRNIRNERHVSLRYLHDIVIKIYLKKSRIRNAFQNRIIYSIYSLEKKIPYFIRIAQYSFNNTAV